MLGCDVMSSGLVYYRWSMSALAHVWRKYTMTVAVSNQQQWLSISISLYIIHHAEWEYFGRQSHQKQQNVCGCFGVEWCLLGWKMAGEAVRPSPHMYIKPTSALSGNGCAFSHRNTSFADQRGCYLYNSGYKIGKSVAEVWVQSDAFQVGK